MAQKTEKEETEFKVVPETITLCVKCGVAGNSPASNMCQKCLNATTSASVVTAATATSKNHVFGEQSFRFSSSPRVESERNLNPGHKSKDLKKDVPEESSPPVKREINRCSGCRRKVGLTGFRCRCGDLFCSEHRYSDRHDCSYDYKAAGRESIARENPVVKAAKIVKI